MRRFAFLLLMLSLSSLTWAQTKKSYLIGIESTPTGAELVLDGKPIGYSPYKGKVTEGIHDLVLKREGYDDLPAKLIIDKTSYKKTFNYTLLKAVILPTLEVQARDDTAVGAQVMIDGAPSGTVPLSVKLSIGRHFVEVTREGFVGYSEWADLKEGGSSTLSVKLDAVKKEATLSIDGTPDALVYIDGVLKGNIPVLVDKVEPGRHLIEAKKQGFTDFSQWVELTSGAQEKLTATMVASSPQSKGGTIKVFSDQDPAQVFLDGTPIGETPLTFENVSEGDHYVQIKKVGYFSFEQNFVIKNGEQPLIRANLTPSGPKAGSIRVISSLTDAEVYIDGNFVGQVPVLKEDLAIGPHIIIVRHAGYADWSKSIDINGKDSLEFTAELVASGSLKILSSLAGAEIFIDGEKRKEVTLEEGKALLFTDIATGERLVMLRRKGYIDATQTVTVKAGETVTADLTFTKLSPLLSDEERRQRISTYSARAVSQGDYAADVMVGFPGYLGEVTATTGALEKLDVGVSLKIAGTINELYARGKYTLLEAPVFGFGAEAGLGGGFGPALIKQADGSNKFGFTSNTVGAYGYGLASLYFRDILTVTTRAGFQLYRDAGPQVNVFAEPDANGAPTRDQNLPDKGARLMVGLVVQLLQKKNLSYNFILEGNPGGIGSSKSTLNGHPRRLMYEAIGINDQLIYVRGGVTLKF